MGVGMSLAAWYVFLASFLVLVILSQSGRRRKHLNLRIIVLGLCVGSLVLHLTSYLAYAVATSFVIWAPKPIIEWRRLLEAAATPHRPLNPLRPAKATVCVPNAGAAWARVWFKSWFNSTAWLFTAMFNAVDRFNEHIFSMYIRLALARGRSRESVHQAVARGDVRKVEKLLRNGAALSEPDTNGRTALHVALERLEEVAVEEEEEAEETGQMMTRAMARGPSSAHWLVMIRTLICHQANVNARDAQERGLHIASPNPNSDPDPDPSPNPARKFNPNPRPGAHAPPHCSPGTLPRGGARAGRRWRRPYTGLQGHQHTASSRRPGGFTDGRAASRRSLNCQRSKPSGAASQLYQWLRETWVECAGLGCKGGQRGQREGTPWCWRRPGGCDAGREDCSRDRAAQ